MSVVPLINKQITVILNNVLFQLSSQSCTKSDKTLITEENQKGYAFITINISFINICMQHVHFISLTVLNYAKHGPGQLVQVIAKHA